MSSPVSARPASHRVESALRSFAHRSGAARSLLPAYDAVNKWRFRNKWQTPVTFRGGQFIIGMDRSLYPSVRMGVFEADEFDWLLPQVRDGDCVWDIGANIGIYSVLFAAVADVQVEAFEPWPDTARRLRVNLALNDVTNVTVRQHALSDVDGELRFSADPTAPGCNHVDVNGSVTVSAHTPAHVLDAGAGVPDVIKIDVEGHEPHVLNAMKDLIVRHRPVILTEVNPMIISRQQWDESWVPLLDWLFDVYGTAAWFAHDRVVPVSSLSWETAQTWPRPASLGFSDRP